MEILPSGSQGILLELGSLDEVLAMYAALQADTPEQVVDLVPAARTILVVTDRGADLATVAKEVRATTPTAGGPVQEEQVQIPVRYDGADLSEASQLVGCSSEELVRRHQQEEWTVAFCGFAPGFGYLAGAHHEWDVPRRPEPRTRVPAGAVGLAGEFTGVYPRQSPGGWQLIGQAQVKVFDPDRDPPALLRPGVRVRFVEADR